MKTLIVISVFGISLSSYAQTTLDYRWIETGFWRAPQAKSLEGKLKVSSPGIVQECERYRRLMVTADGTPTWISAHPEKLERFRNPIDPIVFEIETDEGQRIEQEISLKGDSVSLKDKLPYYTQRKSVTGALVAEATEFRINLKDKGFTSITRGAGLEDSEIQIAGAFSTKLKLEVNGLDAACDLLEGNASLSAKAPAYVYLVSEDTKELKDFYNKKLLPDLKDLVNPKSGELSHRALRIGYRLGKVLETEFPNVEQEQTEKTLLELLKLLFHPKTLGPTSQVYEMEKRFIANIQVDKETEPVTVKLEF